MDANAFDIFWNAALFFGLLALPAVIGLVVVLREH